MRNVIPIAIHRLTERIFSEATNNLSKQLADIHIIQHENTGSPKFFYKGQVYIVSSANSYSVNPLYSSLVTTCNSYLRQLDIITKKKEQFRYLLKKFSQTNNLADLFYVVPKEAFTFLGKDNFIVRSPEYIENIDKSLSHEINLLIKEQLLHTLLL